MVQRVLTVAVPASLVLAVAWWSGGYFPRSFGALLLVAAVGLAAVGLLAERAELGRRGAVLAGALLALTAWQVVTTAWAVAPDAPMVEAERTLVYAATVMLALLAAPARRAADLVLSVLVGAGCAVVSGLVAHALGAGIPDDRLELPVGYPNASGILAATTLLLGLGLTAGTSSVRRAAGGAFAVPAAVALAVSLSRGSILAAALGLVVLCLAIGSMRELATLGLVAVPAAVAVVLVSLAGGLDDHGASPREVLVLLGVAALMVVAARWASVRGRPTRLGEAPHPGPLRRRRLLLGACAVAAVALVAAAAYEARQSRSAPTELEGAPQRLLSTSTSSRGDYWDVAARTVADHPFGGAGAGGFTRVWLRERPGLLYVRDAHNLYLETLAELGPVGLALLLAALATPLIGARRAVASAAGRAALAAYVALVAHAAVDWDWELPVVTLCTLLLAVALVRLGDASEPAGRLTTPARAVLLGGAVLLGAVAIVAHAGNGATADAEELLDRGDAAGARSAAERARRFRPWAAEPWELQGEAELALGRPGAAREHLRRATREDPRSWSAWLSLGLVATGEERAEAIARARALNPLAPELEPLLGSKNP